MNLSNKVIVITGASKGLGRELAIRFSMEGSTLILVARTKNLLEQVQNEIKNLTGKIPEIIACDISNENETNSFAKIIREKYRYIDVLINNAGIGIPRILEKMTGEEMRKQFEVNFFGVFYCIKALLPLIKHSNSGYILNIGSILGKMSFAETSIYSATKFALTGFSEGLRCEMKKGNIKVGLFLPAPMNTSFQDNREEDSIKRPAFITLNLRKVTNVLLRMTDKRKKKVIMYRWIMLLMKIKRLIG